MRNKTLLYWYCQLGGWLFYGLTILFFSFIFRQEVFPWSYARLGLGIGLGFAFTHLLREYFQTFKLKPPFPRQRWWFVLLGILVVCAGYSLLNSAIIEWLGWYDLKRKATLQRRFMMNLLNDSPIIFVWSSIYFVWHYIEVARNSELDTVKLEAVVKELQLKTIKSHINPHFIFNALNSIRALVDENPERARTAITELSNLLRSSMQADKMETTSLERELSIVKDYLALEYIRFEDRLRVVYHIDEDTLDQQVPPMMLQTLVENAIKHGISKEVNGGEIVITSRFTDTHHELIVMNTGKYEPVDEEEGFGVTSTIRRLQLMYGEKASFELNNLDQHRVEAKVAMPLNL